MYSAACPDACCRSWSWLSTCKRTGNGQKNRCQTKRALTPDLYLNHKPWYLSHHVTNHCTVKRRDINQRLLILVVYVNTRLLGNLALPSLVESTPCPSRILQSMIVQLTNNGKFPGTVTLKSKYFNIAQLLTITCIVPPHATYISSSLTVLSTNRDRYEQNKILNHTVQYIIIIITNRPFRRIFNAPRICKYSENDAVLRD